MNDLTGRVYGRLTVLGLYGTKHGPNGGSRRMWLCRCECGKETVVAGNNLTVGHTTSCGASNHKKNYHGKTGEKLYHIWENMIARCTNPYHPAYYYYGGRGIKVCKRWTDFVAFEKDMGGKWKDGLVFDKIDNNADYSPENCRFVTTEESNRNRRNTVEWEYNGNKMTAKELSAFSNIPAHRIYSRLIMGWNVDDAMKRPIQHKRHVHAA